MSLLKVCDLILKTDPKLKLRPKFQSADQKDEKKNDKVKEKK